MAKINCVFYFSQWQFLLANTNEGRTVCRKGLRNRPLTFCSYSLQLVVKPVPLFWRSLGCPYRWNYRSLGRVRGNCSNSRETETIDRCKAQQGRRQLRFDRVFAVPCFWHGQTKWSTYIFLSKYGATQCEAVANVLAWFLSSN